jgi:hypothetical protein
MKSASRNAHSFVFFSRCGLSAGSCISIRLTTKGIGANGHFLVVLVTRNQAHGGKGFFHSLLRGFLCAGRGMIVLMNKQIWFLIAPLVTFGPVFMVMTGGGNASGHSAFTQLVMFAGALMLAFGLAAMFKVITKQQTQIEKLLADKLASPHPIP